MNKTWIERSFRNYPQEWAKEWRRDKRRKRKNQSKKETAKRERERKRVKMLSMGLRFRFSFSLSFPLSFFAFSLFFSFSLESKKRKSGRIRRKITLHRSSEQKTVFFFSSFVFKTGQTEFLLRDPFLLWIAVAVRRKRKNVRLWGNQWVIGTFYDLWSKAIIKKHVRNYMFFGVCICMLLKS